MHFLHQLCVNFIEGLELFSQFIGAHFDKDGVQSVFSRYSVQQRLHQFFDYALT